MAPASHYIVGDWGSSRLRLYLMHHDQVEAEREGPGIGALESAPGPWLEADIARWLGPSSALEVVLGGMASSRTGVMEVAYVATPARSLDWGRGSTRLSIGRYNVLLATGLQCGDPVSGYEVMRGEEAQIFGAFALEPTLALGPHRFIMPGTHSKWVDATDGVITHFRTAITGELYALLCRHSSLLKVGSEQEERMAEFEEGFDVGNRVSATGTQGLLSALFRTRTEQLLQQRSSSWARGYLSGLLIGHEIDTLRDGAADSRPVTIIGADSIVPWYQRAFALTGVIPSVIDGGACARRGLASLREQCQ